MECPLAHGVVLADELIEATLLEKAVPLCDRCRRRVRRRGPRRRGRRGTGSAPAGRERGRGGRTAKIEGLYVAFDRKQNNNNFFGGEVVGVSNTGAAVTAGQLGIDNRRNRDDFGVVRVGVNYKFGTY